MWSDFSLVQLLTPIFCLVMIFRVVSRFARREQTLRELILWIVVWGGIGVVAAFPGVLNFIPPIVGIQSGVNALVFFGMLVLFYAVFRLVIQVEALEQRISEMNRRIALRGVDETLKVDLSRADSHDLTQIDKA
jgi:hypothetical protein